ncbi:hypothetical protein [Campylobacter coli]|uniref:hypothetical protein n=1 Tax=Campylobacter coli TaxID=195 RepID=UPI001CB78E6F|nr:hypothetical protein [Campylobacter coli]
MLTFSSEFEISSTIPSNGVNKGFMTPLDDFSHSLNSSNIISINSPLPSCVCILITLSGIIS